jgi:hypothetical protein
VNFPRSSPDAARAYAILHWGAWKALSIPYPPNALPCCWKFWARNDS